MNGEENQKDKKEIIRRVITSSIKAEKRKTRRNIALLEDVYASPDREMSAVCNKLSGSRPLLTGYYKRHIR